MKEAEVIRTDQALFYQQGPVDQAFPEGPADENDGDVAHLARLKQGEGFEEFVEGAEASGKDDQRAGAQEKMHLAQGKIPELKTEFRSDVGIRSLFMGERDV